MSEQQHPGRGSYGENQPPPQGQQGPQYPHGGPGPSYDGPGYGPPSQPYPPQAAWPDQAQALEPPAPPENVGRGLLFSLGGVIAGIVLTVLVWQLGFLASITSFALAWLAVFLYTKGSGGGLRRGVIPLLALVLVGVLAAFLACIAWDAYRYWQEHGLGGSAAEFVIGATFDPAVLSQYGPQFLMFLLFAGLGVFSTLRGLVGRS